jgi:serine/threonine-protein kinase/endoribonuclease IRE1
VVFWSCLSCTVNADTAIHGVRSQNENGDDLANKQLAIRQNYYHKESPTHQHIDNLLSHNNGHGDRIENFHITNLIITSDIEGNLNAVNRKTGELLWSLVGGQPLVSIQSEQRKGHYNRAVTTPLASSTKLKDDSTSTLNQGPHYQNKESNTQDAEKHGGSTGRNVHSDQQEITWIVEPFGDGTVYHFTGKEGLEKLPISIKHFVLNSPFSIDDRFVYTGTRMSGIVKINAETGAIVESFGLDNIGVCSINEQEYVDRNIPSFSDDENDSESKFDDENYPSGTKAPIITLGKTIYDLTIHSHNNTSWNVTYVQWGPNNLHSSLVDQNKNSFDNIYIQPFHDCSLLALDSETKSVRWVSNLPFVTTTIFDIFVNPYADAKRNEYVVLPHPMEPKSALPEANHDATFLDKTKEGSWYALSEEHYPSLVRSAPLARYITNERWRMPSIFGNDDLLEFSISGVHDNSQGTKQSINRNQLIDNHLAIYQSATAIPIPTKNQYGFKNPSRRLDGDHSNNFLQDIQQRLVNGDLETPTSTTTHSTLSNLIVRALENVFVAAICLAILYISTKLGLLNFLSVQSTEPLVKQPSGTNITVLSALASENEVGPLDGITHVEEVSANSDGNLGTKESSSTGTSVDVNEDSIDSNDDTAVKRKRKRGSRGTRKGKVRGKELSVSAAVVTNADDLDDESANSGGDQAESEHALSNTSDEPKIPRLTQISNNLSITDEILGFGSHGTIVYKGFFENRPVAVKRMLLDFYDVASHEINLLQESDDHSNVVRYFCSQEKNRFLYIALELCSASLEDLIEKKKKIGIIVDNQSVLYQIANGVQHLHSLKIVHRDIKPQNILVAISRSKAGSSKGKKADIYSDRVRFLISDFGLCKKLDADQSSFKGTTTNAAGTSGWRAPELLHDLSPAYKEQSLDNRVRLTKAVDIFSTGCVFFYVQTGGYHPFGDRYIREGNIIKNEFDLSRLDSLKDAYLIKDLVGSMIQPDPMLRPDMEAVVKHPFFWTTEKKLDFLLKVSDRFEVEKRDPPSDLLIKFESVATEILGPDGWFDKFNSNFIENLGKYRKYNTHKLMDLLRAFRNKYHHYQDLPRDLAIEIGSLPDGFYYYFASKFPKMLLVVFKLMESTMKDDELLAQFF